MRDLEVRGSKSQLGAGQNRNIENLQTIRSPRCEMLCTSEKNPGKLVGRHVVRIILNSSPPPQADHSSSKVRKKYQSQSTSSLVANKFSQLGGCTCNQSTSTLPSAQQASTRENQLELAKREKAEVEEEQGRLLALNVELALENKRLLEEQPRLKLEMRRLEAENALWKSQEADMVRANAELVFEVKT